MDSYSKIASFKGDEEKLRLMECKRLCLFKLINYQKCLQETIPTCMNQNYFVNDNLK